MRHSHTWHVWVSACLATSACSLAPNEVGSSSANGGGGTKAGGTSGRTNTDGGSSGNGGASGSSAAGGTSNGGSPGVGGGAGTPSTTQGGSGGAPSAGGSAGNASAGGGGAGGVAPFKVFMIASTAPEHTPMSDAAVPVVQGLGAMNGFTVDATSDTSLMSDENLSHYQVFLQMQLGSFEMPPAAQAALQKFIEQGKGWVGVHAAGLTGIQFIEDKDGNIIGDLKYWPWYTTFIGGDEGFVWSIHPAEQQGTLIVEDRTHPTTKNLPASFQLKDEWYEWKENPRPYVHVLCTADESTYTPVNRQGDHPIVWTNPAYPHTIYIGVGHDPVSLKNANYVNLLRDSILWAAGR